MEQCEACERELVLTKHHLIPKEMHNKKWCRVLHTIKEMNTSTVMVCHDCHAAFHEFLTNKELAKSYYSLEKLLEHPQVKTFIEWVSKNDNRKFKY